MLTHLEANPMITPDNTPLPTDLPKEIFAGKDNPATYTSNWVKLTTALVKGKSGALTITTIPLWEEGYANLANPYYEDNNILFNNNPVLVASCSAMWSSYFYQWMATADTKTMSPSFQTKVDWVTTTGEIIYDVFDKTTSGVWTDPGSIYQTVMLPNIHGTTGLQDFTASPPCCHTCTFSLGDIQVYHWPTGKSPEHPTLTNSAGYTL
jgi:hypothetical protein